MIARADIRLALRKLENPDRFLKEGVYHLCKQVYVGIGEGTEMNCSDYFEEGVDELYKSLVGGKK